ncbi:hypothetical protein EBU71_06560 [bacterium]|nr:hypothetical protein [Candidatus Elulimicrobium humile]
MGFKIPTREELEMSEKKSKKRSRTMTKLGKGLDVGTSFVVLASEQEEGTVQYKDFRDAFYVIKPSTPIAAKMIEKGLTGKTFVKDTDGSFILLGKDAIEKAIERNDSAKRPMYRGVVSSKEKDARKVLSYILKEVAGTPTEQGEKIVFCIPAQPIDQDDEDFDVGYHEDVVKKVLSDAGYTPRAINEAEALCYSELENDDYTGVALSWGAGMVNVCVMLNGEPVLTFSTTKSGDWIDRMAAVATGQTDSIVQAEKEEGDFTIGQPHDNQILAAVSAYYERLIDYTTKQLAAALSDHKDLPKFKDPLPVVIGGGTSQAKGFVTTFAKKLEANGFPVAVKEVRHASEPLHAVARGCLIAASIL